eukprot:COSAG02_NODE_70_length_42239_cov_15.323090_30_plen_76_part_00
MAYARVPVHHGQQATRDCRRFLRADVQQLGRILADHIELTDKCSSLRGPPRTAGSFLTPVLKLVSFWTRQLWIES